jgi:CRISPR locus-related DNA-binding protein
MVENLTLICSFYSFQPLVSAVHAFSPSKMVLVYGKGALKDEQVKKDINHIEEVYGKVAKISRTEVDGADLYGIAQETIKLLEADDSVKVVNITGGWKLLAQGLLYGCYARPNRVSKIVCNNIEKENEIVELPKFTFELKNGKRSILEEINKLCEKKESGKIDVSEIASKAGKSDVMVYQHLAELKELSYVDEANRITVPGRIALLWKPEKK